MNTVKALIIILSIFFAPIGGLIGLISLMVAIDTIFAIYTTVKLNGKKAFKSNKLFNVVVKTFFYQGAIVLSYLIDTFIFGGIIFGIHNLIAKAITFVWVYIEFKSIDETSMKLGNKSIWVIVSEMIKKYKTLKKDLSETEKEDI